MTALDATEIVLREAGEPLHYREITQRILKRGLWETSGKTPWETVNARLSVDIRKHGQKGRFRRAGPGEFALTGCKPSGTEAKLRHPTLGPPLLAPNSALAAAAILLREEGGSLHYRELTKRMLSRGLWSTSGKTPDATLNSAMVKHIATHGERAWFVRTGRGEFALRDHADARPAPAAPSPPPKRQSRKRPKRTMSFTDAAEAILSNNKSRKPMHYREITRQALEDGILSTSGKTPEASMYAMILTEIERQARRGEQPRFAKHGKGFVGLTRWLGKGLAFQIARHNTEIRKKLLKRLLAMDSTDFEVLVGRVLAALGFDSVEVTPARGDGGIDVRGTLVVGDVVRTKMAVQAKRWKNNVLAPAVQQVRGSLGAHEHGLIITTSDFSKGAREEAARPDATPVALMNGEQLVALLIEHEIGVRRSAPELVELAEDDEEEAD